MTVATHPRPPAVVKHEKWTREAACTPDQAPIFFPHRGEGWKAALAISVCRRCPVIEPCLVSSLQNREIGVWGGTSEEDRRIMYAARCEVCGCRLTSHEAARQFLRGNTHWRCEGHGGDARPIGDGELARRDRASLLAREASLRAKANWIPQWRRKQA